MENQESLNLNDLKLMAQIIKVVSARGAVQADEMQTVGALYNKLAAFITAATPKEETAEAQTEASQEANETAPEGETTNG